MRDACAYKIASSLTASKAGKRIYERARSFAWRSNLTTWTPSPGRRGRVGAGASCVGVETSHAGGCPLSNPPPATGGEDVTDFVSIAYGSTGGFNFPGASMLVESISIKS